MQPDTFFLCSPPIVIGNLRITLQQITQERDVTLYLAHFCFIAIV
jgi:hypothetical protein